MCASHNASVYFAHTGIDHAPLCGRCAQGMSRVLPGSDDGHGNDAFVNERTIRSVKHAFRLVCKDVFAPGYGQQITRAMTQHCRPPRQARRAMMSHIEVSISDAKCECVDGHVGDKHETKRSVPTHVTGECC